MIRLLFLFLVLGLGLFAGTQYAGQQGYVLISIANTTLEMSVTTLVIFIIAALAGLFFLEYLVKKLLRASSTTWNWFSVRKQRHSRRYTNEGILKLLEGDWKQAESKVTRWANHHDMPQLCYLVAAEAAHGMGNTQKRDHYLALAAEQKDATLVVELTRAKQQLSEQNWSAALQTLTQLQTDYPDNLIILKLLKQAYLQLEHWQPLLDLLPKLVKTQQLTRTEAEQLTLKAQQGQLVTVASQKGSEGVLAHWSGLPKKLKHEPAIMVTLIEQLIKRKADHQAFTLIKEGLKKRPAPELYALLPELNLSDRHPVMVLLQEQLRQDGNNADIHSALGQLFLRNQQWEEAQHHLEKALSVRPDLSDYAYLAEALDKQHRPQAAHDVTRKALSLLEETKIQ
ncbi:heme biosynthesis protein HemY [Vibrio cincinnatiensis]|uniref:heme biosynthesis protein HemY n=1 Tax=Vibrio cincinnatiensis TaxID=675 RepID=UPI001EDDD2A7|nr:heme biosynthesis HemY N-terminal domain-containing protein [Vibrio cincinnatiensis]MCG3725319.1 tetratricopeptide repeat protein [Vibrio cincinnatiensis]